MKKIKCFKSKKKSWIKGDSCLSNPTSHKYRSQTNFESGNNLVKKSEFVVEKLVTAIKEHFPKLGADTCFDFNKHSELVYKIINNLDLDPGTDKKLPFINLLVNYDEYEDDPQICACVLFLFKNAVEADGEANQILICMKVISTIVEKFKNNTEVIGLNLEIVKVVVSKYATHLPLDVIVGFIMNHIQLILSPEKGVRTLVLNFFEKEPKILQLASSNRMMPFFYTNFKQVKGIHTLNSFLRLMLVYVNKNGSKIEFMNVLTHLLSMASYSEEVMFLLVIRNNLSKFTILENHLVCLFDTILQLDMHRSDAFPISVSLKILVFIIRQRLEIQAPVHLFPMLDFLQQLFDHESESVHNLADQYIAEVLDGISPRVASLRWISDYILGVISHHGKLFLEQNKNWKLSQRVFYHFFNFIIKHGLLQEEKEFFLHLIDILVDRKNRLVDISDISTVEEIISCVADFIGVEAFLKKMGFDVITDPEFYFVNKWVFFTVNKCQNGFGLTDFKMMFDIIKHIYETKQSQMSDNRKYMNMFSNFFDYLLSILTKYCTVIDISFQDSSDILEFLKTLFVNEVELRPHILNMLINFKVTASHDDPKIFEWIPLLFNHYLMETADKKSRRNILSAIKSVFGNFSHGIVHNYYDQILKNRVPSQAKKYDDLINCCFPFFSSMFALELLRLTISSPDLNKSTLKNIKNLVYVLIYSKCGCCQIEPQTWLPDFIEFVNNMICNDSKQHAVIIEFIFLIQAQLTDKQILGYMDFICACLFEPSGKVLKRSKLFMLGILEQNMVCDISPELLTNKLLEIAKNSLLSFGFAYLTGIFLKVHKDKLNSELITSLLDSMLELLDCVGRRGYKSIVVSFIACMPYLDTVTIKSFCLKFFQHPKYLNDCKIYDKMKCLARVLPKYLPIVDVEVLEKQSKVFRQCQKTSEPVIKSTVSDDSEYEFDEYETSYTSLPDGIVKKKIQDEEMDFPVDQSGKLIIEDKKKIKRVTFDLPDEEPETIGIKDDEEMEELENLFIKPKIKIPGEEYRAIKARGDRKLKNKPDPYAFIPLNHKQIKTSKARKLFKKVMKSKHKTREKKVT